MRISLNTIKLLASMGDIPAANRLHAGMRAGAFYCNGFFLAFVNGRGAHFPA